MVSVDRLKKSAPTDDRFNWKRTFCFGRRAVGRTDDRVLFDLRFGWNNWQRWVRCDVDLNIVVHIFVIRLLTNFYVDFVIRFSFDRRLLQQVLWWIGLAPRKQARHHLLVMLQQCTFDRPWWQVNWKVPWTRRWRQSGHWKRSRWTENDRCCQTLNFGSCLFSLQHDVLQFSIGEGPALPHPLAHDRRKTWSWGFRTTPLHPGTVIWSRKEGPMCLVSTCTRRFVFDTGPDQVSLVRHSDAAAEIIGSDCCVQPTIQSVKGGGTWQ